MLKQSQLYSKENAEEFNLIYLNIQAFLKDIEFKSPERIEIIRDQQFKKIGI